MARAGADIAAIKGEPFGAIGGVDDIGGAVIEVFIGKGFHPIQRHHIDECMGLVPIGRLHQCWIAAIRDSGHKGMGNSRSHTGSGFTDSRVAGELGRVRTGRREVRSNGD